MSRRAVAAWALLAGVVCAVAHAQAGMTLTRRGRAVVGADRSSSLGVARCSAGAAVRPLVARVAGGVRVGRVRNRLGAGLFGVATGGTIQLDSRAEMSSEVNAYREVGARWLRIDINWASLQAAGPQSFAWRATDRVVAEARRCGMRVLGVLYYTPAWARPPGTPATWAPDPKLFARFAGQAARHYRRRGVDAFEIWNEPNVGRSFSPMANVRTYTAMLKGADRAIKRADPRATVVTGGLSPSPTTPGDVAPTAFLRGIYAHGGRRFFDAVGAHPYCSPAYPGARDRWSAWYQIYGTRPSLRSIMVAHGDAHKRVWATEFGAPTWGPPGTFVSLPTQAAMVTRAYQLWATYAWAGPLFSYSGRDQGVDASVSEDWYGLLKYDDTPKPAFDAYGAVSRALVIATRHLRRTE